MKNLLIAVMMLSSSAALANNDVGIVCQDAKGLRYEISSKYGEILVYKGTKRIGMIDGIRLQVRGLDTMPPKISIQYIDEDGGIAADLIFRDQSKVGQGTIRGKAVNCQR